MNRLSAYISLLLMATSIHAFDLTNSRSLNAAADLVGEASPGVGETITRQAVVYNWADKDGIGTPASAHLLFGTNILTTTDGTNIILDLTGGNLSGTGTLAIATSHASASSGRIEIRNVGSISCGGFSTTPANGTGNFMGDILIGSTNSRSGSVRVNYLHTHRDDTSKTAGRIEIQGNSHVRIADSSGTPGDILTWTRRNGQSGITDMNGAVTISHDGDFLARDILTYHYQDNNSRGGHLTLTGDALTNGPSGDCRVRNIWTYSSLQGTYGDRGGNIVISGYSNVVITGSLDTRSGHADRTAGSVAITNIAANVTIASLIDLENTSNVRSNGTLTVQAGGAVTLQSLDLAKIRVVSLNAPTHYVRGAIQTPSRTSWSPDDFTHTVLRTAPGSVTYYNPYANPLLTNGTYTLADLSGTPGAGGSLVPDTSSPTVYTSTKTGNWSDPTVWDLGAVPTNAFDYAVISNGHTVTINYDAAPIMGVTIRSTAVLSLNKSTTDLMAMQYITADDGAWIGTGSQGTVSRLYGVIRAQGALWLQPSYGTLDIYSSILGSNVTLNISGGLNGNGNQKAAVLYAGNPFHGEVVYTKRSSYLYVANPNALGVKTNLTITVRNYAGSQSSDGNIFALLNRANCPTNLAELVIEGGAFPCRFLHGRGVTMGQPVRLTGGTYALSSNGDGNRTNTAGIVLTMATTSIFDRADSTYGATYLDGPLSGSGSLYIQGGNGNTGQQHWRTASSNTGGTRIRASAWGQSDRTVAYGSAPFGAGPVWINGVGYTPILLGESATWTNNIRGQGRINTSTHTLTVAGSLSPFDTGYADSLTQRVTQAEGDAFFRIDNLQFGTAAATATYDWQYDETTNDIVTTVNLSFGTASQTINVEWLGSSGQVQEGLYTLFTYTGSHPTLPTFNITGLPAQHVGFIQLDTANKRVTLEIVRPSRPSVFRFSQVRQPAHPIAFFLPLQSSPQFAIRGKLPTEPRYLCI